MTQMTQMTQTPMKAVTTSRDGNGKDPWIRTADGGRFYYLNDDGSQYKIDVAAAALSRLCRYAGHLKDEFDDDIYSVAQHSVYVYRLLLMSGAPHYTLPWALAHDMPEAFFLDLVSPLKSLLPEYVRLEDRSAAGMRRHFGIPYDDNIHEFVKYADNQLYFAERLELTEVPDDEIDLAPKPNFTLHEIDPDFHLWRPRYARARYKEAFNEAMTIYTGAPYAYPS